MFWQCRLCLLEPHLDTHRYLQSANCFQSCVPLTVTLQDRVPAALQPHLSPPHPAFAHSFTQTFFQFLDYVRFLLLCLDHLANFSSSFQSQLGCHFPQEDLSDSFLSRCPFSRACRTPFSPIQVPVI